MRGERHRAKFALIPHAAAIRGENGEGCCVCAPRRTVNRTLTSVRYAAAASVATARRAAGAALHFRRLPDKSACCLIRLFDFYVAQWQSTTIGIRWTPPTGSIIHGRSELKVEPTDGRTDGGRRAAFSDGHSTEYLPRSTLLDFSGRATELWSPTQTFAFRRCERMLGERANRSTLRCIRYDCVSTRTGLDTCVIRLSIYNDALVFPLFSNGPPNHSVTLLH